MIEIIKKKLNEINDKVEIFLNQDSDICKIIKKDLNNNSNIKKERSIAPIISNELYKMFVDCKKVIYYVNEISITNNNKHLTNLINPTDDKKGNRYEVDTYFYVNDKINHIFIEYKADSRFNKNKLLEDFMKYKCYTIHNDENSMFVYFNNIFDKNNLIPNKKMLSYKLDYNDKKYLPLTGLFYYINDKNVKKVEESIFHEESISYEEKYKLIKEINDKLVNHLKQYENFEEVLSSEEEKILKKYDFLNFSVIEAQLLQRNYFNFIALLDSNNHSNDCFDGAKQINDLLKEIGKNDRGESKKNAVRGSSRQSFNIIVLVSLFFKEFEYKITNSDEDAFENQYQKFKNMLRDDDLNMYRKYMIDYIQVIKQLYSVMYIVNNDSDNELFKYSTRYKNIKFQKDLHKLFIKIMQLFNLEYNYKNELLTVEKIDAMSESMIFKVLKN